MDGNGTGTAMGTAIIGTPIMLIRFMFIPMFMFMFGDMPIIGFVIHICGGDSAFGLGLEDVRSRPPILPSAIDERLAAPRLELALLSRGRTSGAEEERVPGARAAGWGGARCECADESRWLPLALPLGAGDAFRTLGLDGSGSGGTGGGSLDPSLVRLTLLRAWLDSLPLRWSYTGLAYISAFSRSLPLPAMIADVAAPAPMATSIALPLMLSCGGTNFVLSRLDLAAMTSSWYIRRRRSSSSCDAPPGDAPPPRLWPAQRDAEPHQPERARDALLPFWRSSSEASDSDVDSSVSLPLVDGAKRTAGLGLGFCCACGEVVWRVTVAVDVLVLGVGEVDDVLEPEMDAGLVRG
ncbi:uncharacterized protein B0H18DRAFT_965924 [Fomitopsis serialis]|uniref:uncharacterized protein n=1 Tax=Fomitopsis serialis TaxID=139415 RepID=UPI002008CE47|nr:uncharacterized protein B0H18DRAFT_965924 [Neoantrodia serialis]KAH9938177.1 hypothetical protein B0H18DRAFT_965924 [Neoantrodia serialis]